MIKFISIFIIFFFIYLGPRLVLIPDNIKISDKTSDGYIKSDLSDTNIIDIGPIQILPKRIFSSTYQSSDKVHEAFLLEMSSIKNEENLNCEYNENDDICESNLNNEVIIQAIKDENSCLDKNSCCM